MNGLTLKMLREAIAFFESKDKIPPGMTSLLTAHGYMVGSNNLLPYEDPRDVLKRMGYMEKLTPAERKRVLESGYKL
tara:strand:- start:935 stop:1165 length:231 start_codon:yes stop_codon:yes gene_type:complete